MIEAPHAEGVLSPKAVNPRNPDGPNHLCSERCLDTPTADDVTSPLWAETFLPGVTMYLRPENVAPQDKTMLSCGYADFNNPAGVCADGGGPGRRRRSAQSRCLRDAPGSGRGQSQADRRSRRP